MNSRPVIDVRDVTKTYTLGDVQVHALRGVSFTIERGEYVAIMGPSGSGKSTLMNLLGCLDRPSTGRYLLDGIDVSTLDDDALAAIRLRKLGFVFQGFNLLARTSALKNVALPLFYAGASTRDRNAAATERLREVGLEDRLAHNPRELSGGQQPRVAIARALVNDPFVLVADEPTGNLDERATRGVFQLLRDINASGTAVVMATHNLELVRRSGYRTIEINRGQVVFDSGDGDREKKVEVLA